jgi:mRNA interferase MazF
LATFVRGDVVVVPFPFSDLTQAKRRPALVVATLTGDDVILCQVTSQSVRDQYSIPLTSSDFEFGSLQKEVIFSPIGYLQQTRKYFYTKWVHFRLQSFLR